MPLIKSTSKGSIGPNIKAEEKAGRPYRQALAIALATQDRARRRAAGGSIPKLAAGGSGGVGAMMGSITGYSPGQGGAGMQGASAGSLAGFSGAGTGAPQMGYLQTAAPNINANGYVPVNETGDYQMDLNTGALTPQTQANMKAFAERGLNTTDKQPVTSASSSSGPTSQDQFNQMMQQYESQQAQNYYTTNWRGGKLANGGVPTSGEMAPWYVRREASSALHPSGYIHMPGPGRTDNVPMVVAADSHVIPADVVAGLGEGNGLAGAHSLDMAMHTGPGGVRLPSGPHRDTIPRPPAVPQLARGGDLQWQGHSIRTAKPTLRTGRKCIVAGGEYIIPPAEVAAIGRGDLKRGHRIIDDWIMSRRKKDIHTLRHLPGPVKGR